MTKSVIKESINFEGNSLDVLYELLTRLSINQSYILNVRIFRRNNQSYKIAHYIDRG